jgi:hypothetical protein
MEACQQHPPDIKYLAMMHKTGLVGLLQKIHVPEELIDVVVVVALLHLMPSSVPLFLM